MRHPYPKTGDPILPENTHKHVDRLFLDTNIVLDFLQKREPYFEDAKSVFALSMGKQFRLYVSDITFSNIAFICRKSFDPQKLHDLFILLRKFVEVVGADNEVIDMAISLRAKDFEDAVQYCSAMKAKADCILTRNPKDFPFGLLPVYSASEFLNTRFRR